MRSGKLMVPAETPRDVVFCAHLESAKNIRQPEIREKFIAAGEDPLSGTPEQFGSYMRSEIGKRGRVVRTTGMQRD